MKSAVIVPGKAPQWVESHARHIAQRLTSRGRVLIAFGHHSPAPTSSLPGHSEQSSLFGHSVSGYPLWMGRVSAVLGLRRKSHDTILVLWNGANVALSVGAALVARLRRERLTVVLAEQPRGVSLANRMCRKLVHFLAHDVVCVRLDSEAVRPCRVAVALCGSDAAFADVVIRAFDAMSDEAAKHWQLEVQVARTGLRVINRQSRPRQVSLHVGELPARMLWEADVVIAPDQSPSKHVVAEAVLFGGVGIAVGGPVAGRVLRQPDGVWLAKQECAALIVAFEASSAGASERPHSIGTMRVLAEDVVALLSGDSNNVAA